MFSRTIAKIISKIPSSLKYRLSGLRPLYLHVIGLGEPAFNVKTTAGPLRWVKDGLTSQTFLLGTYEKEMQEAFRRYVVPGSVVYDIGAHAGFHTLYCSLLVGPKGRVISFEPNPDNRASIERQLAANPQAPVTLQPYAVSDRCGEVRLDTSRGSSRTRITGDGDVLVESMTIDSLVAGNIVPPPDVIKIDVEGHDLEVLKGAMQTVAKSRPTILCDYNTGINESGVEELLAPLSYKVRGGAIIVALPE
jgi:FkbM family methyltransferase